MPTTIESTAEQLQRRYNFVLRAGTALLLLAVVVYGWMSLGRHQSDLRAEVGIQAQEIRLVLNHTIDVARAHAFAMQRTVEYRLQHPGPADAARLKAQQDNAAANAGASLHLDPTAQLDPQRFQRELWAAMGLTSIAAPAHQWHPAFQWSYYVHAGERWILIYPQLSRDALLSATATRDIGAALRVVFEGNGTRPVSRAGPRNNPQREMVWTQPYKDTAGKGLMVSLLTPVYLGDEYVGAVGIDVTLAVLDKMLGEFPLAHGRALVIDAEGMLLADSGGALQGAKAPVRAAEAIPGVPVAQTASGSDWQRLPLQGTPWTLLVQVPERTLLSAAAWEMRSYFVVALVLFLAILGTAAFQIRNFSWPALRLAGYAEKVQDDPGQTPPEVPAEWRPSFERLAAAARERHALLETTRRHAGELEQRVAERTAALTQANAELAATVQSLQQTQHQLIRADRLGSLGGLVAGVAHELDNPIGDAGTAAVELQDALALFRDQQRLGLRRAELDEFLERIDDASKRIAAGTAGAHDLVQRFRQLAVDRNNERNRIYSPRALVDDILVVMAASLRQAGCNVRNDIPPELAARGDAGTLGQLLTELINDAAQRSAKTIAINARWEAGSAGEAIVYRLDDDGGESADAGRTDLMHRIAAEILDGGLTSEAGETGRVTSVIVPAVTA